MKVNSLFAVLLLAGSTFASAVNVVSPACLAVMPVDSTQNPIIIAVPWVQSGASSTNTISITNFVLTANLTAMSGSDAATGDLLQWYDVANKEYKSWVVKNDGGGSASYWDPVQVVASDGSGSKGTNTTAQILKQGDALMLTRRNPTTSKPVYLVGQVGTNETVEVSITPAADASTPSYTLIAPPYAESDKVDIASVLSASSGSFSPGDMLILSGSGSGATWNGSAWAGASTIRRGRGVWYKRVGTSALTIQWSSVPKVTY